MTDMFVVMVVHMARRAPHRTSHAAAHYGHHDFRSVSGLERVPEPFDSPSIRRSNVHFRVLGTIGSLNPLLHGHLRGDKTPESTLQVVVAADRANHAHREYRSSREHTARRLENPGHRCAGLLRVQFDETRALPGVQLRRHFQLIRSRLPDGNAG